MPEFTMIDHEHKRIGTILAEDISDGYHTITELYEHRYALFCALVRAYDSIITPLGPTTVKCWKARVHNDGTMIPGHFIAGITKQLIDGTTEDITYHLPLAWWERLNCVELITGMPFDGYDSNDVIQRLLRL